MVRLALRHAANDEAAAGRALAVFASLQRERQSIPEARWLARLWRLSLGRDPTPQDVLPFTLLHSRLDESRRSALLQRHLRGGRVAEDERAEARGVGGAGGQEGGERTDGAEQTLVEEIAARMTRAPRPALGPLLDLRCALESLAASAALESCPAPRLLADRAAARMSWVERDRIDRHLIVCPECLDVEDARLVRQSWTCSAPEDIAPDGGPDSLLLPWEQRDLLGRFRGRGGLRRLFPWLSR